jgi:hypothetical protein
MGMGMVLALLAVLLAVDPIWLDHILPFLVFVSAVILRRVQDC